MSIKDNCLKRGLAISETYHAEQSISFDYSLYIQYFLIIEYMIDILCIFAAELRMKWIKYLALYQQMLLILHH